MNPDTGVGAPVNNAAVAATPNRAAIAGIAIAQIAPVDKPLLLFLITGVLVVSFLGEVEIEVEVEEVEVEEIEVEEVGTDELVVSSTISVLPEVISSELVELATNSSELVELGIISSELVELGIISSELVELGVISSNLLNLE